MHVQAEVIKSRFRSMPRIANLAGGTNEGPVKSKSRYSTDAHRQETKQWDETMGGNNP
jgi:hypothetical protein